MKPRQAKTIVSRFALIISAAVLSSAHGDAARPDPRPNVLFILVDDLGPWLGTYGKEHVHSPHIDELARSGMQFNRAYAQVPVCGASRASMFTGMRPTRTRFTAARSTVDGDATGALTLPKTDTMKLETTLLSLFLITPLWADSPPIPQPADTPRAEGFRGIWFDLGQKSEFGSKYSGGLGTYTANHVPMAHYVEAVNRTYLTWGGTPAGDQRKLQILVSYYDHNTGKVARPVIVQDRTPVDDPHDNGSLTIDGDGYLWVFVSGRGTRRPGSVFRSKEPYGIDQWLRLPDWEFTYPQPWQFDGKGLFFTYTRYTRGRELYFRTSRDGMVWDKEQKLAGLRGHYQTSARVGDRIITAFNRHPGGNVDRRTDLFYMETPDMGKTWTTADGTKLEIPITENDSPARIRNYSSNENPDENALVYICDVIPDADGHPVILYITSKSHQPGPSGNPRMWKIARWTGAEWRCHEITTALHNYDMGSLYIEKDGTWKIIAPIGAGPQHWGTGGEIEIWTSNDHGANWEKQRAVTAGSERNHSYVRRPVTAHPDFHAYWADGNADELSESHLWFTNKAGDKLWRLPYTMTEDFAVPVLVEP